MDAQFTTYTKLNSKLDQNPKCRARSINFLKVYKGINKGINLHDYVCGNELHRYDRHQKNSNQKKNKKQTTQINCTSTEIKLLYFKRYHQESERQLTKWGKYLQITI